MKAVLLLILALVLPALGIYLAFAWFNLDWCWWEDADNRGVSSMLWVISLFIALPAWGATLD
jgi:hypothetical protein